MIKIGNGIGLHYPDDRRVPYQETRLGINVINYFEMKQSITYAVLMIIMFALFSCEKNCKEKDDNLTISKTSQNGTLRINGFYSYEDINAYSPSYSIFVLYNNGVVLQSHTSNINDYEANIPITDYSQFKNGWGAFYIQNNSLRIEVWEPRVCGYPVYVYKGHILNDSTFWINEYYRASNNENYTQLDDTFRFKQTASKPDSIQPYL